MDREQLIKKFTDIIDEYAGGVGYLWESGYDGSRPPVEDIVNAMADFVAQEWKEQLEIIEDFGGFR